MEDSNELVIDNSYATSMAHLLEAREAMLLQHGGVCTRIDFDKVEAMDLHTFLTTEVPKLNAQDRTKLTVLRNAAAGSYTFLLGDQVLRYNTVNVTEAPLGDLMKMLETEKVEVIAPNIPYPLVVRAVARGAVYITVRVASVKRHYILNDDRHGETIRFEADYYPPPVWFGVALTSAGTLLGMSIAVAPDSELHWENTSLYPWPLSNVFGDARVCLGDTTMSVAFDRKLEEAEMLQMSIDRFFNSAFNFDIPLTVGMYDRLLGTAYEEAAGKERYAEILQRCESIRGAQHMLKVLCVLEDPAGWRKLNYAKEPGMGPEARTFCHA